MKKLCILLFCLTAGITSLVAAVRLPKIFSSNMVLQRDVPVKIWGWTEKNATVSVAFNGQLTKAKANANGMWLATLKPMKYGGPFEMKISDRSGATK